MRVSIWNLAVLAVAGFAAPAHAINFSQGHGDVGIWHSPGEGYQFRLSSGNDWQSEPESGTILVNSSTRETIPAALATPGSGLIAGGSIWKLPQSATEAALEGAPWLGIQVHRDPLASGGATSSSLLNLEFVSSSGPGQFVMWQDIQPGALGLGGPGGPGFESRADLLVSPGVAFNSAAAGGNHVGCWNHMHAHANWGFTVPGEYDVTLRISGNDAGVGDFSDTATFTFVVEDALLNPPRGGDVTGDGAVDRSDVVTLLRDLGTQSGATSTSTDLDGDGRSGLADLSVLQRSLTVANVPPATWGTAAAESTLITSPLATVGVAADASALAVLSGAGEPTPVPEPATLTLFGVAALGLLALRARRRKWFDR